jgi:sugar-phosphatase
MRLAVGCELLAQGLLFDMDGTLIDSRGGVERLWKAWCEAHGLDFAQVLPHLADSVRRFTPARYSVEEEIRSMYRAELDDVDGVVALPGTRELLAALPPACWTVVTSADQELARARLRAAQVMAPAQMVGGDDVSVGKPDPEGYVEAARRLGCAPEQTLIFEDAAAGIQAGRAAGGRVIGIASGDPADFPADLEWVPNLASLQLVRADADGVRLRVVG